MIMGKEEEEEVVERGEEVVEEGESGGDGGGGVGVGEGGAKSVDLITRMRDQGIRWRW